MADLAYTAAKIRPLDGSQVAPPKVLGAPADVGDWVKLQLDGTVIKHTGAADMAFGIIVSNSRKTIAGVTGDEVGICTFGPVAGFSNLNPGRLGYLSATAGRIADSGTKAAGYAQAKDVFFVMPGASVAAS